METVGYMLEHKSIRSLEDFFVPLGSRQEKGVYFYRINGFNQQIAAFVKKYYDLARRSGVILEGKIPNPDEKNLSYYGEIMGDSFVMSLDFITRGLAKWLPRMTDYQRNTVSAAIFDNLQNMQRSGKTENMLKNAYVKFMCWLYYKFERITSQLGENNVPKILYEGSISNYELMLISILSNAGCDVVLLQHQGDGPYLKTDPTGALSDELKMPDMGPFPEGWSLKSVRDELQRDFDNQRLYGAMPDITNCTNAWQKEGRGLDDIRTPIGSRGSDPKLWYNVFCRINGVWDKMVYSNDLFTFYQELKNAGRKIVVINGEIPKPTPEEIAGISRKNYTKTDQMLMDLISNINFSSSTWIPCSQSRKRQRAIWGVLPTGQSICCAGCADTFRSFLPPGGCRRLDASYTWEAVLPSRRLSSSAWWQGCRRMCSYSARTATRPAAFRILSFMSSTRRRA